MASESVIEGMNWDDNIDYDVPQHSNGFIFFQPGMQIRVRPQCKMRPEEEYECLEQPRFKTWPLYPGELHHYEGQPLYPEELQERQYIGRYMNNKEHPLKNKEHPLKNKEHPLNNEEYLLNNEKHLVNSEEIPLNNKEIPLNNKEHPLNEEHTLNEKQPQAHSEN